MPTAAVIPDVLTDLRIEKAAFGDDDIRYDGVVMSFWSGRRSRAPSTPVGS